jgi:flagella basal body P-ring formation protein FlgA
MPGVFFLFFFLFPFYFASGSADDYFVKLAVKSVEFRLPEAGRLIIDGRVLNRQVLSGCTIKNVVPLHRLSIERAGNYLVQLKVRCKNSFLTKTLNVNLKVDAEVEGYKTTETVERGEHLSGKVKKEKLLLSRIRGNVFNGDINKVVAKVKLLPGTVILWRFVEVPFAVKRGELVKIIAKKDGIYVETTGRALQNGHIGDTIKVKNVYSRKVIEGKVKDEGTVVVNF